jgi:hypothetical protein
MLSRASVALLALALLLVVPSTPLAVANSTAKAANTALVAAELRRFVDAYVEPAIASMQGHEAALLDAGHAPPSDCFGGAAGRGLRWRCCIYFSNVMGALLEARFGTLRPARAATLDFDHQDGRSVSGSSRPATSAVPLGLVYELTAKWLLAHLNDPLAIGVRAEQVTSVADIHAQVKLKQKRVHVHRIHGYLQGQEPVFPNNGTQGRLSCFLLFCLQAATLGPLQAGGPVGRYAARVAVAGIDGTLLKCEAGTTHTFLVFRADGGAADDVVRPSGDAAGLQCTIFYYFR